MESTALYRTLWRWHFYAGLFVLPFILILSLTGAAYLFKPQIERWEERDYIGLGAAGAVSPNIQTEAALAAFPGASFHAYRLPREDGDAAMIHLGMPDGRSMRDVFVSPQGRVLGSINPDNRIAAILSRFHGSLMIGTLGDRLVELAASWAIVTILTGLYLWWPRGRGIAGVAWPRIYSGRRVFLRDIHAVTGFWVSGFALVLLVTGLPWAGVWGSAFRAVRTEMGWAQGVQNWETGPVNPHAAHDHPAMMRGMGTDMSLALLDRIIANARVEDMAFPVMVLPPGAPQSFGPPTGMVWTVKSEAQNRPLQRSVTYGITSGREISRSGFAAKHPVDRVINYGIAWHEGQLFGWVNQLIGLLTAAGLVTLAVSGFLLWRRRKPAGQLGAPPSPPAPAELRVVAAIILALAALIPLLAVSLILLWLVERLIVPRFPSVAAWLGIYRPHQG